MFFFPLFTSHICIFDKAAVLGLASLHLKVQKMWQKFSLDKTVEITETRYPFTTNTELLHLLGKFMMILFITYLAILNDMSFATVYVKK